MATTEYYGTGRRKTSTARVFLRQGKGTIVINRKPLETAFPTETLRLVIRQPLVATENVERFDILATTAGGNVAGQQRAIPARHRLRARRVRRDAAGHAPAGAPGS